MKTTTMIAFFAVLAAVTISALSMSSAPISLATGSALSGESGMFMGHVELVVRDSDGNIIQYVQTDNEVTNEGDNCVMEAVFDVGSPTCTLTAAGFTFIGIGNATIASANINGTITTLSSDGTSVNVALTGGESTDGIMAIKEDTATTTVASTDGGTAEINTTVAFTFSDGGTVNSQITNTTDVTSVGLFDANCNTFVASGGATDSAACATFDGTQNLFSVQTISVTVGDGDSLSVTWTITVGDAN